MVSGPLIDDQLAFRVAAEKIERELDIEYASPELETFAEDEYEMLRSKLLFTPSFVPGLELEAIYNRVEDSPSNSAVDGSVGADPFDRRFGFDGFIFAETRETEIDLHVLRGRYALGEDWELSSTSSYTLTSTSYLTPQSFYDRDEVREDRDFAQELRLNYGEVEEGRLSGFVGLFYSHLEFDRDSVVRLMFEPPAGTTVRQDLRADNTTENRAIFAEWNIPIMEKLMLSLGARYDEEEFENSFLDRSPDPDELDETSGEFDAFLPRASLTWQFRPEQSLSFIYSEGYRAGFAQFIDSEFSAEELGVNPVVDAEYLRSYEISYRSEWLDNRLRLNANIFFYDWVDQQVEIEQTAIDPNGGPDLSFPLTVNAGRSEVYGTEFEVSWQPMEKLTIGASLGYVHTKFTEFPSGGPGFEVEGNEFPGAPSYSAAFWGRYEFLDRWHLAADWTVVDDFFSNGDLLNNQSIEGYDVVNLHLGFTEKRWKLGLTVRNLFDQDYIVGRDAAGGGVYVGDKQNMSVSATYRF